jgi:alkylhydroperoxidase family enzyme
MARMPYVKTDQVAPDAAHLINRTVNISRMMGHSLGLVRAISSFSQSVRRDTALPQRYVEFGILTIAWEMRSAYEWAHHLNLAKRAGVTDEDLAAIKDRSNTDELGTAIIRAARAIAHARRIEDSDFAVLETQLGAAGFVDLVYFLGVYCGIARFLVAFEVEVEDSYESILLEHPFD